MKRLEAEMLVLLGITFLHRCSGGGGGGSSGGDGDGDGGGGGLQKRSLKKIKIKKRSPELKIIPRTIPAPGLSVGTDPFKVSHTIELKICIIGRLMLHIYHCNLL